MRGYFDMPWGQVHYRTAPAASELPVLLLMHQSPLSSRNYERLLPLLASVCRPYALDTPGYGASDPAPPTWEVDDYANVAFAAADHLGVDRFHLFGRATGAVFATDAAMRIPARVRSLILHGMPVYTDAERADRLAGYAPPYALDDAGGHLEWIWRRIHTEYPWIDAVLATHLLKDFLAAGPDFASSYRAIFRRDLGAALRAGIPVPTLLIGATRDRIGHMHERAVAALPKAEAVLLDGATDFVAEQEPQRFADVIAGFLRRN